VEIAFKNHAGQSASPVVTPNNHHRDRNAPNGAAAETGFMPRAGLCRIEF
jgi:hypothetical protein